MAFSERFNSNWDLSAARAAAVADYFMASAPIDSDRINVLGLRTLNQLPPTTRQTEDPRIEE